MSTNASEPLLYIDTQQGADDFLTDISGIREIAVDTEGASFHRFIDRIYLLQISTRERSAVIDPLPIGMPKGPGEILEDKKIEVVFHDADYDCWSCVDVVIKAALRNSWHPDVENFRLRAPAADCSLISPPRPKAVIDGTDSVGYTGNPGRRLLAGAGF